MNDSNAPGKQDQPAGAGGPPVVTIRCRENGPLVVELPGDAAGPSVLVRVTDHLGQAFSVPATKRAVALCRCGQTKTAPFCDGAHKDCGFSAANLAPPADRA